MVRVAFAHSVSLLAGLSIAMTGCRLRHTDTMQTPPIQWSQVRMPDGAALAVAFVGRAHRDTALVPLGSLIADGFGEVARERTLIVYDPRARGRSSGADTSQLSLQRDVEDLEEIRRHFGVRQPELIGWSYGAAIVARYAMLHPSLTSRVILVSPLAPRARPFESPGAESKPAARDTVAERLFADARARQMERSDPVEYCRLANRVEAAELIEDATARMRRTDVCALPNEWPANIARSTMARLLKLSAYDWTDDIAAIRSPMFIVVGTRDFIPVAAAQVWARAPGAQLCVIAGAGHYLFLERPDELAWIVARFADGKGPTGGDPSRGRRPSPSCNRP